MILHLDDNMLMLIELLPSLIIILFTFLIQRCVWDVIEVSLRCQTCVCCMLFTVFMSAAMYDAWCLPVNKCYNVRSGFYLSGLFTPAHDTQAYSGQNPADQVQCKWLVLPQHTWEQWNPIPLCNNNKNTLILKRISSATCIEGNPHIILESPWYRQGKVNCLTIMLIFKL